MLEFCGLQQCDENAILDPSGNQFGFSAPISGGVSNRM